MAFAPLLITAVGAIAQAQSQKSAADYNAQVMDAEGRVSGMQANEATNTQVRQGNFQLGRMTAAAEQSGGGIGGSTAAVLNQSTVNAELDALNVRYAGILKTNSYNEQAGLDSQEGRDRAAATLVSGAGGTIGQYYKMKANSAQALGTYQTDGFS